MNDPDGKDKGQQGQAGLSPTMTAVFIGFLIGILVYSAAKNTWGLVTLVPLFVLYRLLKR
jgi:hypothetical protein